MEKTTKTDGFSSRTKVITASLLTAIIFGIDCLLIVPGYAFWLLYLSPLSLLYNRPARDLYRFATLVTFLMLIGYFIPSLGRFPIIVTAVNRTAGIVIVWLTTFLLHKTVWALNHAHQERHKLQQLIETLPAGVVFAYPSGEIVLANAAAVETFGGTITATAFKPQGKYTLHKLDGTPLASYELPLTRALEKGESTRNMPLLVRYTTGKERILSADVAPIRHNNSKNEGAVSILTDVTEREIARKQLVKERTLLQTLFDNIPVMLAVYIPEQPGIAVNRYFKEVTGWTAHEMQTHDAMVKVYPDDDNRLRFEEFMFSLTSGFRDFKMIVKNGTVIDTSWANAKMPDGRQVGIGIDIRERKRYEQLLLKTRKRYELVNLATNDIIWDWDLTNNQLEWNKAVEAATNRSRTDMPPTVKSRHEHIHPEDHNRVVNGIQQAIALGKKAWKDEYRFGPIGGPYRIYLDRGLIARDENGRAYRMIGSMLDLTERKKAEETLKQSESQFRQLADSMPQLVWVTRPDGYHEYFNERWYEFTGTQPGETTGEMWARLLHPDDYQRTLEIWHHSLQTGEPYNIEYRFKRGNDGTYHWFIGRAMPVRNEQGEITRWLGTCTYIHDMKMTEQALRESEATLNAVLETLPSGIIIADARGRITRINPAARELWGVPPETDSWEQYSEWIGWRPETGERIKAEEWAMARAIRYGEITRNEIVQNKKFNSDERRYFINSAAPLHDSEGRITGGVVAVLDITDRRAAEEALKHRTEELAAANRDLESFSYSVSHDLRNPLHTIGGFAQFLIEDYAELLNEEGRDYLRRINDGVGKMQSLINDILNLSRIGKQEMKWENIDLSAMVKNYLQELKNSDPGRQQTKFKIEENVHANADSRLIHLAFENLLRNAWKFTAKRDVTRIEFGSTQKDGQTAYFVRDNGEGFDMRFSQTIFEPFKRVHAQKEFGGTGVGLSIVKRVIGKHGGKVWAEGKPGEGASFYFTLK